MKQILLSSILLISCTTLSAQSISIKKVGDITPVAQPTEVLPAYDTTSLSLNLKNIVENPHYYDGQKILFLPIVEGDNGRLFDYYSEFFVENEVACPEYGLGKGRLSSPEIIVLKFRIQTYTTRIKYPMERFIDQMLV